MNRALTMLVFGAVCFCLSACGGSPELGTATSTPKVDQKTDRNRRSAVRWLPRQGFRISTTAFDRPDTG